MLIIVFSAVQLLTSWCLKGQLFANFLPLATQGSVFTKALMQDLNLCCDFVSNSELLKQPILPKKLKPVLPVSIIRKMHVKMRFLLGLI